MPTTDQPILPPAHLSTGLLSAARWAAVVFSAILVTIFVLSLLAQLYGYCISYKGGACVATGNRFYDSLITAFWFALVGVVLAGIRKLTSMGPTISTQTLLKGLKIVGITILAIIGVLALLLALNW